jgi:HEAT repeat protein
MPRRTWVLLALLPLLPASAGAQTDSSLAADKAVLRAAGVDTDGPGLLAYVKKRTLSPALRGRIDTLIKELGAEEFDDREKASEALLEIGVVARPQLRAAVKDSDPEVRRRARRALSGIGGGASDDSILPAASRVLASLKPPGALAALLDFLSGIEDAEVRDEVVRGLAPLAVVKGKPDPALAAALTDKLDVKRSAAGALLARAGGAALRPGVRKLLKDPSPAVRRRVALALLEARDKEAIPVLIAQITEANEDLASVEEALNAVAGGKSPDPPAKYDDESREKYRKSWETWWKDSSATIDLAKLNLDGYDPVGRGFTLMALLDTTGTNGKVVETDASGRTRWTIGNLRYPIFATKTRRDRVVIGEYYGNKISERSTRGTVIWEKIFTTQVVSAQRLANGNLFVATRNQLVELDRAGKEVKTINRSSYDLVGAYRYRDGRIIIAANNGQVQRLDSTGRLSSSFYVGYLSTVGLKVHFLENGHVIVPNYAQSKVVEYDSSGKSIWEARVTRPNSVHRMANGHTIVGSRLQRQKQVTEIDKSGQVLNSWTTDGRPLYVEKR